MQGSKLAPKLDEYNQCISKKSYSNCGIAKAALRYLQSVQRDTWPLDRYLCPWCGAWHIGHRPMTPESVDVDGSFRP